MCDDIMGEVSGLPLSHVPASLKGYSRRRIAGERYPAIIEDAESCVGGVVYRDVPDAVWERLD